MYFGLIVVFIGLVVCSVAFRLWLLVLVFIVLFGCLLIVCFLVAAC